MKKTLKFKAIEEDGFKKRFENGYNMPQNVSKCLKMLEIT